MAVCKKCGASIVWIETPEGGWMPGNAGLVNYWKHRYGGEYIITPKGEMVYCTVGEVHPVVAQRCERNHQQPPKADGRGYIPHWATCPNADDFRGRKG